jgi:hypothetical protein
VKQKPNTKTAKSPAREARSAPHAGALARFFRGWRLALWVVLLLGAFAAQAITSMAQKCPVYDETVHLPAGYSYLKTGDFRINPEHPPLAKMLAALPLLFQKIDGRFETQPWRDGWEWQYGWEFLYGGDNNAYVVVFWGRLMMALLSLCLGALIFFWARGIYGNGAGVFALFLFAFCPNLIAHGSLTNTDLSIAFFFLLALFCFDRALRRLTSANAALAGLTLGLALLTKFSAPLLLPVMGVVALARIIDKPPIEYGFRRTAQAATRRGKLAVIVVLFAVMLVVAYGVLWAGYGFRFSAFSGAQPGAAAPHRFAERYEKPETPVYGFLYHNRLLPEAYLTGFRYVQATVVRGSFLDGRLNFRPGDPNYEHWPQYFFMTSLYKTPVPMLIFFCVAVLLSAAWGWSGKTWRREVPLIAAFVIYFGVAVASNMNIGHRHILPVIPLAMIFVSKIANHLRGRHFSEAVTLRAVFALLLGWHAFSALSIHPNYLAYFNEIAGGPGNGANHLTDSNIDWGQDLILLKRYMDEHHIEEIHLDYFGSADPRYYGIKFKVLSENYPLMPVEQLRSLPTTDEYGITRNDYVAISVTNLEETYRVIDPFYRTFRGMEPIAKIGYSIYIYKWPFRDVPPAKEREAQLKNEEP